MSRLGIRVSLGFAVLLVALATAAIGGSSAAALTGGSCAYEDTNYADIPVTNPQDIGSPAFDGSVACVINEQRVESGLRPLRYNDLLHDAAWIYGTSMLSGEFYDHNGCVNGRDNCSSPIARLRLLGYIRHGWSWIVGETLRGAHPDTATPNDVVEAWLESPEHRAQVLKPKYRDFGVASVPGITDRFPTTDGVTVVAEYGFREQHHHPRHRK